MNPQQPQLNDISGLADYGLRFAVIWPWVLGGVICLLVLLWAIRWWIKRPKPTKVAATVTPDKPIDLATRLAGELHSLIVSEPFDRPDREHFYFMLSRILRGYIELRAGISASDFTITELKQYLSRSSLPLDDKEWSLMWDFLKRADLVKFAERSATAEQARQDLEKIKELCSLLKPRVLVDQEVVVR